MASLNDWWQDFRDIKLIRFEGIKAFSEASGQVLNYENFKKILYMYRIKVIRLLQDVWHRGAIMIIKKFKFLKRRGLSNGRWTYSGFQEQSKADN